MISHILAWIVLLSEGEHEMLTKPCNLTQMTLIELYNKSHEGFMLSKSQENTSIGRKPNSRVYHDAALTKVREWVLFKIQGLTLNQSCSLVGVLQTLFKEQEPKQLGSLSNKGSKIQLAAIFPALRIILSHGDVTQCRH
jgi:hypothetical protein